MVRRALLWAVGLAVAGGIVWGVWASISGWNATKAELAEYDLDAERSAAVNDSLQAIIVESRLAGCTCVVPSPTPDHNHWHVCPLYHPRSHRAMWVKVDP